MSSAYYDESNLPAYSIKQIDEVDVIRSKTKPGLDNVDLNINFITQIKIS